ncbi:MAG: GerMN domain-containing protein [Clostridiaceae bacterium]|nr:GerMN domain-containing protein [Clostridiaceae bacterium]
MKKTVFIALTLALCLIAGCATQQSTSSDEVRAVYFLTQTETGRRLGYEVASFDGSRELKDQIRDVIEAMRTPLNKNDISLIWNDIELSEVQVFGSTVVIRFSDEFEKLSVIEASLLSSGVTLSLMEISQIRYVRVIGGEAGGTVFMGNQSILLDDEDLRLSAFEIGVYPVSREDNNLFSYQMRIVTEEEKITPLIVLKEMISGQLGVTAPFDGRMDIRSVSAPNQDGLVRADLYVPVEMDLTGREVDIFSIVDSLCSCRGVTAVNVTINGRVPSERNLKGCDGPLAFNSEFLGESDFGQ